jgi:(p)ppGpp synthase/HD superfamily hydrolase
VDVYNVAKKYELKLTLGALKEAKKLHSGMWRADGREAFTHPLKVSQILIFYILLYGILGNVKLSAALLHDIDVILAAAALHDILEDVKKNLAMMKSIRLRLKFSNKKVTATDDDESILMKYLSLRFPEAVISLVAILTKDEKISVLEYCQHIGNRIGAVLIKLADRLHNLRNMIRRLGSTTFFTKERLREQKDETIQCILKLAYWVEIYEEKFPTENQAKYLAIAEAMTAELKKTVHLAEIALAE